MLFSLCAKADAYMYKSSKPLNFSLAMSKRAANLGVDNYSSGNVTNFHLLLDILLCGYFSENFVLLARSVQKDRGSIFLCTDQASEVNKKFFLDGIIGLQIMHLICTLFHIIQSFLYTLYTSQNLYCLGNET